MVELGRWRAFRAIEESLFPRALGAALSSLFASAPRQVSAIRFGHMSRESVPGKALLRSEAALVNRVFMSTNHVPGGSDTMS